MDTGKELFEHELRDMYDAEHKMLRSLESMAKKVASPELTEAFELHRKTTETQIQRLEKVFELVDRAPRREPCEGINGLIEEFSEFVKEEDPAEPILNVFASAAAIKVEHYEICAYKSLIRLADQMGLSEAAQLMQETLREEQQTAQELETLSEKLGQEVPA